METLVIRNNWALGDTVCLSALVRDIHAAYPGRFRTVMAGNYPAYWEHCPYASAQRRGAQAEKGRFVQPEYGRGIHAAGRGEKVHFVSWFHRDFERQTGIRVPVTRPHGEVFIGPRKQKPPDGRYWVVMPGCKTDMPAKQWDLARWQETVDVLESNGVRCVQAGADFRSHVNARLRNVEQYVGRTDAIEDFFNLIRHADGVVCGITSGMHVAAALGKPCVVIAGGREEPWWEGYTNCYPGAFGDAPPLAVEHVFLHTVGLMDCCEKKGCWKDKVVALSQADVVDPAKKDKRCKYPLRLAHQDLPECMSKITADHVVEGVMSYYEKGHLPPVGEPKKIYRDAYVPPASPPPPPAQPEALRPKGQARSAPPPRPAAAVDHPTVGGRYEACVLGFGDHVDLMKRCLRSVIDTTRPGQVTFRVALNQPSRALEDYVAGFDPAVVIKTYVDRGSRRKYPAMRAMFHDPALPISTRYVLWFDDDSHVVDPEWLEKLSRTIVDNHPLGSRLFGAKKIHDLAHYTNKGLSPEKWFRAASWWKGRFMHFQKGARAAINGSQIVFASGGFWALSADAMRLCDVPDVRLNHNGGDICIGEQVNQGGFKTCDFSQNKRIVRWSDAERRGFQEPFPWAKGG